MDREILSHLLKGGFMDSPEPVRGSALEAVSGQVGGYHAEFGVQYYPRQNSSEIFYRVKLRNPPRIPLFLWDKCPVGNLAHLGENESRGYVTIRGRKWLTKTREIQGDDELAAVKKITAAEARAALETLARVAARIESGELRIDKAIARSKMNFMKDLAIVLLIAAAAAILLKIFVLK